MNPRIIIDKSILQSMSEQEFVPLDKHLFVIVPPILIKEILGNLAKDSDTKAINRVRSLANRIRGVNSHIVENYKHLLAFALLGNEPPMDGRIIAPYKTAISSKGYVGSIVGDTPDDEAVFRWQQQDFTTGEKSWAHFWRNINRPVSGNSYITKLKDVGVEIPQLKNDDQLKNIVDEVLANKKAQSKLFYILFDISKLPFPIQSQAIDRWFYQGQPLFKEFSPYATFCLKAILLLTIGLTNPQIFRRDKNNIKDLEYCFYLPFCEIFTSSDKLHRKLIPMLTREDQTFVFGEELSKDLKRLAQEWNELSEDQKLLEFNIRKDKPKENPDSVVSNIWKKHRPDYKPEIVLITDSERKAFTEALKPVLTDLKNLTEIPTLPDGSPAFIKKTIRISKKKLKEIYPNFKD